MTPAENAPPSSVPGCCHRPLARLSGRDQTPQLRAAADELALTQSAVSKADPGAGRRGGRAFVLRHTRAVELTSAGAQLHRAVGFTIERMDAAVRLVRQTAGRRSVAITTWASFASMRLIPGWRTSATTPVSTFALMPATRSWTWTPRTWTWPCATACPAPPRKAACACLASSWPWWPALAAQRQARAAHTGRCGPVHPLIEASDAHRSAHLEWLSWRRWLDIHHVDKLQPERWLYFNYAHQIAQAALSGQGLAAVAHAPDCRRAGSGESAGVLPQHRIDTRWPTGSWWAHAAHSALKSRRFAPGWLSRLKSPSGHWRWARPTHARPPRPKPL